MNHLKLKKKLEAFLLEDIGDYDATSTFLFTEESSCEGAFLLKEDGVIAGLACIEIGYHLINPAIEVIYHYSDREQLKSGTVLATVKGPVQDLLAGERVILNLLGRMSGIATTTRRAVDTLNSPYTRVCDTRKTLPGLRMFDKYAVTCGGGYNHRYGLYDGIMLKDNHIAYAGSITKAIAMVREHAGHMIKVEVETESRDEVLEAVEAGADVIMFDNCTPQEAKEYAALVPEAIITEISGGITPDNIGEYRDTHVNYMSLGYVTQSAKSLDISFNIDASRKFNKLSPICEKMNS